MEALFFNTKSMTSAGAWIYHENQQVIMPEEGRPNWWFDLPNDEHKDGHDYINATGDSPMSSSNLRGHYLSNTYKNNTDEDEMVQTTTIPLQIVLSPWYYPKHHQEIVHWPTKWLGGGQCDASLSPIPRHQKHNKGPEWLINSNHSPSCAWAAPIRIEGYSSSIKDSPFFH